MRINAKLSQADIREQWFKDLPSYRLDERPAVRFELTFPDAPGGKYYDYHLSQKFHAQVFNFLAAYQCEVARIHLQNVPPLYKIVSDRLAPLHEWTTDLAIQYSTIEPNVKAMNEFNAVNKENQRVLANHNAIFTLIIMLGIAGCVVGSVFLFIIVAPIVACFPWMAAVLIDILIVVSLDKTGKNTLLWLQIYGVGVGGYFLCLVICEIIAIFLWILAVISGKKIFNILKKKIKKPVPIPNSNPQEWCMVRLLDVYCDALEPIDFDTPNIRDRNAVIDHHHEHQHFHEVSHTHQVFHHHF